MSKVVATYDTDEKTLSISIDGVDKGQVERFSAYSSNDPKDKYGYFEAEFKSSLENDVRYRMSAHGSKIEQSDVLEDYIRDTLRKNQK